MSNDNDKPIRRAASRLRITVFVAMVLIVLIYVAAGLGLQLGHAHVEYRLQGIGAPYAQWIGGGSLVLLLIALLRLSQMLGGISGGELFSIRVTGRFRGFALWLLLMAVFEFVAPIIAGSLAAPPTFPHRVRLALDMRDLLTVGITLLLFLLASLLERARRLDEEIREFV